MKYEGKTRVLSSVAAGTGVWDQIQDSGSLLSKIQMTWHLLCPGNMGMYRNWHVCLEIAVMHMSDIHDKDASISMLTNPSDGLVFSEALTLHSNCYHFEAFVEVDTNKIWTSSTSRLCWARRELIRCTLWKHEQNVDDFWHIFWKPAFMHLFLFLLLDWISIPQILPESFLLIQKYQSKDWDLYILQTYVNNHCMCYNVHAKFGSDFPIRWWWGRLHTLY